ncbi:MAG: LPXTG cell wall anchor domain-containing protein [Ruminococcaceae bacterium]|nr:LPXTG cell wall anchor domain-containing protein [Oscillospiraceae bacterium]
MKRFLSILLVTLLVLSFTAFAADSDMVNSPNDEPSTDDMVDVPGGDEPADGDDSPQTGVVPIAAVAGVAVLGIGAAGVVVFRKKNA